MDGILYASMVHNVIYLLPIPAAVYAIATWRGRRLRPVQHMGAPAILGYLRFICLQVFLVGIVLFLNGRIGSSPRQGNAGLALMLTAAIGYFPVVWATYRSGVRTALVTRVYAGLNGLIAGVIAFGAIAYVSVSIATEQSVTSIRVSGITAFVYLPAAVTQLGLMLRHHARQVA